jgi:hypothetical protein
MPCGKTGRQREQRHEEVRNTFVSEHRDGLQPSLERGSFHTNVHHVAADEKRRNGAVCVVPPNCCGPDVVAITSERRFVVFVGAVTFIGRRACQKRRIMVTSLKAKSVFVESMNFTTHNNNQHCFQGEQSNLVMSCHSVISTIQSSIIQEFWVSWDDWHLRHVASIKPFSLFSHFQHHNHNSGSLSMVLSTVGSHSLSLQASSLSNERWCYCCGCHQHQHRHHLEISVPLFFLQEWQFLTGGSFSHSSLEKLHWILVWLH